MDEPAALYWELIPRDDGEVVGVICEGRVGVVDLVPETLHFQGSGPTTVAAKRVFGIGDPMLLERRARALADAAGVPLEALDVALFNFGAGDERATMGASATVADRVDRGPIAAALGVD